MLTLSRRVDLPDVVDAEIYGDDQDGLTYYIVPTRPALELDDRERPTLRLLVYLTKNGAERSTPSGGQVTLTTVLEVSVAERARITHALEAQVSGMATDGPGARSGVVHLVNPDWASGTVTVRLTPTLTLTGQPALFAGNRCALMSTLTADQAQQLHDDGRRTLAGSTIRYDLEMRVAAAASASGTASRRSAHVQGGVTYEVDRAISLDAQMTGTVNHPVTFEGPLWDGSLEAAITDIELS